MDLDEFKDAITCMKPIDYAGKIEKSGVMTAKELSDLFHYPSPLMDWKCGCSLYDNDPYNIQSRIYATITEPKKRLIFISVPTHSSIGHYIDDLRTILDNNGFTKVVRVNSREGWLETYHVRARMIPDCMIKEGLRCDASFGFPPEVAILLNPDHRTNYPHLSSVPNYIFNIEHRETRKEEAEMNTISNASAAFAKISASLNANPKPAIKNVIFNDPATIVMWSDGTKTVVKAEGEDFDPEKGLAMAISKKNLGNKYDYYNTFKHWIKKYYKQHPVQEKDAEWTVAAKPVDVAYHTLMNIISAKGTKPTKPELEATIQEAIGYLGEALDK